MFTGFNLSTTNDFKDYLETGTKIFEEQEKLILKELKEFSSLDGTLDGTKIQSNWFPQVNADIFISHSHADQEQAIGLAGWLKQHFNITSFIDSTIWGNSRELLKIIDNEYCLNEDKQTYDYQKRNYSTSHVYLMLSTALTKMIDKTECILFLNTPSSISAKEVVDQTRSPWIYHEIAMTHLVKKKELEEYRDEIIKKALFESKILKISYDVRLDHFNPLNQDDLNNWYTEYTNKKISMDTWNEVHFNMDIPNNQYALDVLYKHKNLV